jgi:mannose/fructose/N-acetylgalactosamine-specific phosphotransferase system component IIB
MTIGNCLKFNNKKKYENNIYLLNQDIRNYKILSEKQINFIKILEKKDLIEIIILMNNTINVIASNLEVLYTVRNVKK